MATEKKIIHLTAYYGSEKFELQTYPNEYRNLMMLLFDKIYIEETRNNGYHIWIKMGLETGDLRLACQILVDENLENATVKIIGDRSLE